MADTTSHRHDAEETRAQVLSTLQEAHDPLHPLEIAARVGVHVNTVHRHLEVLEATGLVAQVTEPQSRPGRPRVLYQPTDVAENACLGHRFLSRALAAYVAARLEPAQAGQEAGEAWGRHLIAAGPFARTAAEPALRQALDLLQRLGFSPTGYADDQTLELGRCPYPELAAEFPALICSLHLGLVQGALKGLGAPLRITDFEAHGPDEPCVLRYASTDEPPSSAA